MSEIARDYFKNNFLSDGISNVEAVLSCVTSRVSNSMNRFLTRPISYNEVKTAVSKCLRIKLPGPMEWERGFFKSTGPLWDRVWWMQCVVFATQVIFFVYKSYAYCSYSQSLVSYEYGTAAAH